MTCTVRFAASVGVLFALWGATVAEHSGPPNFYRFAPCPPMGWNSWDCFGTGVTEAQVRANADYMAKNLVRHGWTYVTIDIDWFVPGAQGWDYKPNAPIEMNKFAIVQPAPDRFPSAQSGLGFKPLAEELHKKGLKLGLHLLRGIPRKAVEARLPIEGTSYTAADIANKSDTCPWNPDMYGVDMSKPGAQDYYDSLFRELARWGVDLVKVDDLSTPYHEAEINAIRAAIDKSGRAIVFSTSPGPTGLDHGVQIEDHANMWRISNDFWDDWNPLKEQFERLDRWTPYRGAGHWPDADMLPLGAVRQGQKDDWTHFTPVEQRTLLTLWSIARSPLILGGDLPKNDQATEELLTNDEVLGLDRNSSGNRQLWRRGDQIAWVAEAPHSRDKYLAVFNAANQRDLDPSKAAWKSQLITRNTPRQSVVLDVDVKGKKKLFLYASDGGDGNFGDHVVWADPILVTSTGLVKSLTGLMWVSATQGYGQTQVNHSATGHDLILDNQPVSGIGTHANSMIEYDLPAGVERFQVRAGLGKEGVSLDHGATVQFMVFTQDPTSGSDEPSAPIQIDLKELGFPGQVEVKDLWTHRTIGQFRDRFSAEVPWHGAELYRLTPK